MSTFAITIKFPEDLREAILDGFDKQFAGRGEKTREEHVLKHIENFIRGQVVSYEREKASKELDDTVAQKNEEFKTKAAEVDEHGAFGDVIVEREKLEAQVESNVKEEKGRS